MIASLALNGRAAVSCRVSRTLAEFAEVRRAPARAHGVGHDTQNVARFAPMGMIFIPSRGGISYSPVDFTAWQDVANGAEVLYRAVLLLDPRLNCN